MMEEETGDQRCQVLPDFLWLLRDVDCIPTGTEGQKLSPTDYLRTVLQTNKSCGASSALLCYFSSLQCLAIPPPSTDEAILTDITNYHETLSTDFNKSVDSAIQHVLENVKVKEGYYNLKCDGSMLACLIEQHFTLINREGSGIPTIQVSWLKAVEMRLRRFAESLVSEYEEDMTAELKGKLPMIEGQCGKTGETLMNVHLQVFAKKRQQEILCFHSHSFCDKISDLESNLIADFNKCIAECDPKMNKIVGGKLFNFIQENIRSSERFCKNVYKDKYNKNVSVKLQNALFTRVPTTIEQELAVFHEEYFKEARGPAIHSIFKQLREESTKIEEDLLLIPGPVQQLKVVGVDSDRVKLRWKCPDVNSRAVEQFKVMIKSRGKDWEVLSTRKGYSALVTGLESRTWYCLSVIGMSSKYSSGQVSYVKVRTRLSKSAQDALIVTATVASPIALPCMAAYYTFSEIASGVQNRCPGQVFDGAFYLLTAPSGAVAGLIPGFGSFLGHHLCTLLIHPKGNDIAENDTEVLRWHGESSVTRPACVSHSEPGDKKLVSFKQDLSNDAFRLFEEESQSERDTVTAFANQQGSSSVSIPDDCIEVDVPSDSEDIDPNLAVSSELLQDLNDSTDEAD